MGHGVSINEVPTGVKPAVSVTAGLPVYVGTAPINMGDPTAVNKPVLISTLAEAVNTLGYLDGLPWSDWTLLEAISAHFKVYGVGPIVCINVTDPTKTEHIVVVSGEAQTLSAAGIAKLAHFGALLSTVVVKTGPTVHALGTDYTLAFDSAGMLVVTRVTTGTIAVGATLSIYYTYLNPAGVSLADIIGGYSAGKYTGLEVVEQVYPKLRLVPGFIVAPFTSEHPTVAARMAAIAHSINGAFRAMALTDLSSDEYAIASYAAAAAWKTDNGYTAIDSAPCWPKFMNGTDVYHLSTVMACRANLTDNDNNGIPFASPSNKAITGTAAVLDDGSEVLLTRPQANALNDQGITTALNGFNGWRLWGNRTGGYPGTTDVKDAFVPIRRMFNWIGNTIILTTDRDVDEPGNKRLIDGVVGTVQSFLNGLIAAGALVDGKIEFRSDENSTTDLSDGKITFHVTLTPPSPSESIEFTLEYDPSALAELFA